MRVSAGAEVSIVAMRGRVGQLVAVGCPDGPELAVAPCKVIDGFRLETGVRESNAICTRQCRPRYPLMLAILPATVDRAESGSRPRRRRDPHNDDEDPDKPPTPSSHLTTSRPSHPEPTPPPTRTQRGIAPDARLSPSRSLLLRGLRYVVGGPAHGLARDAAG